MTKTKEEIEKEIRFKRAQREFEGYKSKHSKEVTRLNNYENTIHKIAQMMEKLEEVEANTGNLRYKLKNVSGESTFNWNNVMGLGVDVETYGNSVNYLAGNLEQTTTNAINDLKDFYEKCGVRIAEIVKQVRKYEVKMSQLIYYYGKKVGSFDRIDTGLYNQKH